MQLLHLPLRGSVPFLFSPYRLFLPLYIMSALTCLYPGTTPVRAADTLAVLARIPAQDSVDTPPGRSSSAQQSAALNGSLERTPFVHYSITIL
jgi:hypothetical protein